MKVFLHFEVDEFYDENFVLIVDIDLKHSTVYNITIRAQNHLGQSRNSISIRAETKDVPIEKEGLELKLNEFYLTEVS
jgi:hypothetical protein